MSTEQPVEPSQPEQLPEYVIEGARSGRSRCKACRRPIPQGALRIGMLIEGPYGTGYLWFHLNCAAKRQLERVEEAYEQEAWKNAKEVPHALPSLDELRANVAKAQTEKKEQRALPYAELAPSGRSRCKHCSEPIAESSPRIVLAREVSFGRQTRTAPIFVHPRCTAAELLADDCATEVDGFDGALRANSTLAPAEIGAILAEIGPLGR